MANQLASLLKKITDNYAVIVFIISMIPLIELKGAIPIGTKLGGISLIKTAMYAYLGSTVVCVLVFFLLKLNRNHKNLLFCQYKENAGCFIFPTPLLQIPIFVP